MNTRTTLVLIPSTNQSPTQDKGVEGRRAVMVARADFGTTGVQDTDMDMEVITAEVMVVTVVVTAAVAVAVTVVDMEDLAVAVTEEAVVVAVDGDGPIINFTGGWPKPKPTPVKHVYHKPPKFPYTPPPVIHAAGPIIKRHHPVYVHQQQGWGWK